MSEAMEASRTHLVASTPSIRLPALSERCPGHLLVARIRRNATVALMAANGAGAVVTFLLGALVIPPPAGISPTDNLPANIVGFVVALIVGLVLGTYLSNRASRLSQGWLKADRVPTPEERDATLRFPLRQTAVEGVLWLGVAIEFFFINLGTSAELATQSALQVSMGGLVTCSLTYLMVERLNRDAMARALESGVPERPAAPSLGCRLVLSWAGSSAVPLLAIGLIACSAITDDPPSPERLGVAVLVVSAIGVLVGLTAMSVTARTLSEPLRSLRTALGRVEEGELDVRVQVDDAGEIGVLQGGFNRMALGLQERERLRDLFGRHVGEDVARRALEREDVELGGETREAAVLFVDVIGSTRLASTRDPAEVVARLNEFFAVVVDTVSLRGGWVNKFEGDAALCVFGAPTAHPDPAGSALASARALQFRLRELEGVDAAIGVSAGLVVAGNVGAAERFEYTVIGDPVNEAARLTELAKTAPGKLLASDAALQRAGATERARWSVDREESLRGRTEPTRIAQPA